MCLFADRLILPNEAVVVGLSGGRDSVALLRLLLMHGVSVSACHVHHGIRGEEADADAAFCRHLCENLNVPYAEYRVDVPLLVQKTGNSLETEAREQRRRLLAEHVRSVGLQAVALAHHADDQAETALFNLCRGAAGVRGMKPVYRSEGIAWWRPLLYCRRSEITTWLRTIGQNWRDDSTNSSPLGSTRNKLRLLILPELSSALERDVVPLIARSARVQGEVAEALDEALSLLPLTDPQGRLYLPFLVGKSESFRRAVVHFFLKSRGVPELSERIVSDVCAILAPDAAMHCCNLPGGLIARRSHRRLRIDNDEGRMGN